ncbi:hypothetical protein QBC46DRAFT_314645 [Diplogelasinospora grovesii]|uniref:Uncharacterized protein n=1 Tax=Diplogelasinospora grovesii TaxID=303347 RepID=A0AAN6S4Y1_9PEZI|nr:hypothetical protein QBC46DRAFT_314645 [Diplogelasinospora grovesii]
MYHTHNKRLSKYRLPPEEQVGAQPPRLRNTKSSKSLRAVDSQTSLKDIALRTLRRTSTSSTPATPNPEQESFDPTKAKARKCSDATTVNTTVQDARDLPPPWDRTVDIVWVRDPDHNCDKKKKNDKLAFHESCVRLAGESAVLPTPNIDKDAKTTGKQRNDVGGKGNCSYFKLPDRVRFMICKHVVKAHNSGKAIRLNTPACFDPVWPANHSNNERVWSTDYFDSLEKVLALLKNYASVCFAMRVDMLATLFLTRRFHVVYSPFVTPTFQPAAHFFMDKYGPLMKYITLEVDLSRLAGHWQPSAAHLDTKQSLSRVRKQIQNFAARQMTRHGGTKIESLVILVRRYYGCRPAETGTDGERTTEEDRGQGATKGEAIETQMKDEEREPEDSEATLAIAKDDSRIPYCADSCLDVLDPIKRLGSVVASVRIVGTSKEYAGQLIGALWGKDSPSKDQLRQHLRLRTPSCVYPLTPGQSSALDFGPPHGVKIVQHVTDPKKWIGLYGCRNVAPDKVSRPATPYFGVSRGNDVPLLRGQSMSAPVSRVATRVVSLPAPLVKVASPTTPPDTKSSPSRIPTRFGRKLSLRSPTKNRSVSDPTPSARSEDSGHEDRNGTKRFSHVVKKLSREILRDTPLKRARI